MNQSNLTQSIIFTGLIGSFSFNDVIPVPRSEYLDDECFLQLTVYLSFFHILKSSDTADFPLAAGHRRRFNSKAESDLRDSAYFFGISKPSLRCTT
jgi:hypothetical protein